MSTHQSVQIDLDQLVFGPAALAAHCAELDEAKQELARLRRQVHDALELSDDQIADIHTAVDTALGIPEDEALPGHSDLDVIIDDLTETATGTALSGLRDKIIEQVLKRTAARGLIRLVNPILAAVDLMVGSSAGERTGALSLWDVRDALRGARDDSWQPAELSAAIVRLGEHIPYNLYPEDMVEALILSYATDMIVEHLQRRLRCGLRLMGDGSGG